MSVRVGLQHCSAEGRRRPLACQAIPATLTPVEKLVGLAGADTGRVDVLGHLVVQDVRPPGGQARCRSRKRFVLPDAVFGIASMNSMTRGTL